MFDWVGAGIGLLGSILGDGQSYSNPQLEAIMSELLKAYREQEDFYRRYGTPEALAAADERLLGGFDQLFGQDADLRHRQYTSQIMSSGFMPGMSDSEWGVARGVIERELARRRAEARLNLEGSRLQRSRALMPDTSILSSATGAASEIDRTNNMNRGLDWGELLGVLQQAGLADLFKRGGKKSGQGGTGGDQSGGGSDQSQVRRRGSVGPSAMMGPGLYGHLGGLDGALSYMRSPLSGGGRGGGSAESVNHRYRLPEYGLPETIQERIADRLMYGGGILGDEYSALTAFKNRFSPSRRY